MALADNPGRCPAEAAGKRIHVVLRNGYATRDREPSGWAADGKAGCDWSLSEHPFSIVQWEVI